MGAKQEDAQLILKLDELRRESVMREARTWFIREFHPTSAADILETLKGEHSAHFRMVTSYWEMAASLVNHGAIDAAMFSDANAEHMLVFAKLEPYLAELRTAKGGSPRMLAGLEKLMRSMPNSEQVLKALRERVAGMYANAAKR
jgi:hypothetical protein